jgi:hypothetical protein
MSTEELAFLITQEMEKCGDCAAALRPEIFWHQKREGCNWDVDILGDSDTDAEVCDECIQETIQMLRAKYNLSQPV